MRNRISFRPPDELLRPSDEQGCQLEVIFHADDLGATPGVSRKILDGWEAGLITGFSLIVNGTGVGLVAERLNQHPEREARIAVHLNISDGRSLLAPEKVPGLVDREGYLKHGFLGLFLKLAFSLPASRRKMLREVESEWREQIRRAKAICHVRNIRAIDGHIHVHMLPCLFPLAARLAVEEGIPEIRLPRELWSSPDRWKHFFSLRFFTNGAKWALLRFLSVPASRVKKRMGLGGPRAFIGILNAGRNTVRSVLNSLGKLERMNVGSCEILFHIGGAAEPEVSEWRPHGPTYRFLISGERHEEYEELKKLRACFSIREPGSIVHP